MHGWQPASVLFTPATHLQDRPCIKSIGCGTDLQPSLNHRAKQGFPCMVDVTVWQRVQLTGGAGSRYRFLRWAATRSDCCWEV